MRHPRALRRAAMVAAALLAAPLLLGGGERAQAAALAVDSTLDGQDASPGDGVCLTAEGTCTLRAAVQEANALPGPDTIGLPAGTYQLAIAGTGEAAALTGDLDLTNGVTIAGAGRDETIIDGGALDRVFDVAAGVTVTLSGVTIRNGLAEEGGAIISSGSLTVSDSAITENEASSGGALLNRTDGSMVLEGVVIADNHASLAGGLRNHGSLTLTDSEMRGNVSEDDGGAAVNHGTMTATRSRFVENASGDNGGAIWGNGTLVLVESTLAGNTAADEGGAVVNFGGGDVTLTRSTVSDNQAVRLRGGGLVNYGDSTMTLENTTVSGNTSGDVGGGILDNGSLTVRYSTIAFNAGSSGGAIHIGGSATLRGTVLSDNTPDNCAGAGATVSQGANVESAATCGLAGAGDRSNTDPQLPPLADNGGPTLTHALPAGSPALDAGGACPPPATDQRGVVRAQGASCDAGAFEREVATTPTPTPAGATGDASCDGVVNAIDAALALQHAAGLLTALPCPALADANGDGQVNAVDAALMLQYAAGLLTHLPP